MKIKDPGMFHAHRRTPKRLRKQWRLEDRARIAEAKTFEELALALAKRGPG